MAVSLAGIRMASSTLSFLLSFILVSHLSFNSAEAEPSPRLTCSDLHCKEQGEIGFFSSFNRSSCGVHNYSCQEGISIQFEKAGRWYVMKNCSEEEKMLFIQDAELNYTPDLCTSLHNFTAELSFPPKTLKVTSPKATFFRCEHDDEIPGHCLRQSFNYTHCSSHVLYYFPVNISPPPPPCLDKCAAIEIPMQELPTPSSPSWLDDNLEFLLDKGFALRWETPGCFACHKLHSSDNITQNTPSNGGSSPIPTRTKLKISIGATAGISSFLFAAFLLFLYASVSLKNPISFWKRKEKDVENVEEFLKNYGSVIPRRYLYSELKQITNSFKDKLGQGGYGSVFKGKLSDGRLVAVKVLDQSKGSGEEFINEVASIGRTYHVNVVALLGFCSQGSRRALVYEFMPNGSLERFIYSGKNNHLGWQKLSEIALGIARGLEYLHRGCNTRILHFDIKPHNILLDKDFCPKISDFGLAKLCPSKESTISLLGARGTIGYIAPEVCCRNFGGVSSKSDVYSYGMMVLEMVGGRRNIDAEAENTSEIYFPDWIYKRLDVNGDLGLHAITAEVEEETVKKMVMVGLWCIQTDPRDRPSMGRVVEMLEGSVESLPVPPKPFLYSPTRPNQGSSTTSLS